MKLLKLVALGVALVASAPFAFADGMNQISFTGSDTYYTTTGNGHNAGDVVFTPQGPNGNARVGGTSTGVFAPFTPTVFNPTFMQNTVVDFNNFNANSTGSFVLFNALAPTGQNVTFTVTSEAVDSNHEVTGTGFYTFQYNGNISYLYGGTFDMTTQGQAGTLVTFSDTNTVTPEPSSLMLLGTGLVSAAGMLVRRRRAIKA